MIPFLLFGRGRGPRPNSGRGTGVHSLTVLPGSSLRDPTIKKTQQQKKTRVPNTVMTLCFYRKHGRHQKRVGGGRRRPPFANKMISTNFPHCKHGDDVFNVSLDGILKNGWLGGGAVPFICKPR